MAGSSANAVELITSSLVSGRQSTFQIESWIFQIAAVRPLSHRYQSPQDWHRLWGMHGRAADDLPVAQPHHTESIAADIATHDFLDPRKSPDDLQIDFVLVGPEPRDGIVAAVLAQHCLRGRRCLVLGVGPIFNSHPAFAAAIPLQRNVARSVDSLQLGRAIAIDPDALLRGQSQSRSKIDNWLDPH